MPLLNVPNSITPELLYALAKMGHGDTLVIADANFPSDSTAAHAVIKDVIRVHGTTAEILADILHLMPLDTYASWPVYVMDRVQSDKDRSLAVPAYSALAKAAKIEESALGFVERFAFYEQAKRAFVVVQTDDRSLYANAIVSKGVI